ncbi:MAG: phycobilisome rod-core linker polypeptide [Cyanobacteriota bacterium]|nr:phycobilisome rod-core linker polypeptide [Cyanobacteriota bacterium]MEC8608310.1 phycobilisome rod-core linker polypeptide [Cyanobacteriota bacterium]
MAIPLLPYAPITQNARVERIRVGSDEDLKVVALDQSMDAENLKTVIEAAYRQIFFHAFKSDRDRFLESQLRNGQITVRDFIRGLCLSDTFTRTFYGFNSNYKVVRHLVERLLGRKTSGKGEELSWSIVIATKGVAGMVDALLDSEEYLDNFGFDTVPYQRHRVLPGRDLGDTPFNITTPRYDEYHRDQLGFPQIIFTGDIKRLPERARVKRGGDPADYMAWVGGIAVVNQQRAQAKTTDDYMSRVPYRSISR